MLKAILRSTRITWAAKNVHMYLLTITYAYQHNLHVDGLGFLGGLFIVSMLWGALYSLNDLTDVEHDRKDALKSNRPFVEDEVEPGIILLFIILVLSFSLLFSYLFFNPLFVVILLLMILNQLIYTLPPIRLKETFFAPFTSTATNNVLRLASASILIGSLSLIPSSVYILMFMAGMGTYLMYKKKFKETTISSIIFCLLLLYTYRTGEITLLQIIVAILPPFLAAVPLYVSMFAEREKMLKMADILYHRILIIFYLSCIILFLLLCTCSSPLPAS